MPPPGGSTRMTSAPSAANVAPPRGAAMYAEISTRRSPDRRGGLPAAFICGAGPSFAAGAKTEEVKGQLAALQSGDDPGLPSGPAVRLAESRLERGWMREQNSVRVRHPHLA